MPSQNKPRLSDITKKNATDRASKLAGSFLPPVPAPAITTPVTTEPAPSLPEVIQQGQSDFAQGRGTIVTADEIQAVAPSAPEAVIEQAPVAKPKERTRRSAATIDLAEMINQPVPEGLRCTRMIMLCDVHHDLLRELSFKYKKPMTALLYNLLEPANQANQREKQKGGTNHV